MCWSKISGIKHTSSLRFALVLGSWMLQYTKDHAFIHLEDQTFSQIQTQHNDPLAAGAACKQKASSKHFSIFSVCEWLLWHSRFLKQIIPGLFLIPSNLELKVFFIQSIVWYNYQSVLKGCIKLVYVTKRPFLGLDRNLNTSKETCFLEKLCSVELWNKKSAFWTTRLLWIFFNSLNFLYVASVLKYN